PRPQTRLRARMYFPSSFRPRRPSSGQVPTTPYGQAPTARSDTVNEKTPPKFVFLLVFAALLTAACGGDSLGPQIDRMGRAAVNTALIQPFTASMDVKQAAKDNYNAT